MKRSNRIGYWIIVTYTFCLFCAIIAVMVIYRGQAMVETVLFFCAASAWYFLVSWTIGPMILRKPSAREMRRMAMMNRLAGLNRIIADHWDAVRNKHPFTPILPSWEETKILSMNIEPLEQERRQIMADQDFNWKSWD